MSDTALLAGLCAVMFGGAFAAGMLPLAFTLNEERLRVVTAFGAGLLVGSALIIILPEGVQTLYSGPHADEGARYMGLALAFGFAVMFVVDQLGPAHAHAHGHAHGHIAVGNLAQEYETPPRFSAAFVGLLIHNAADGLAMGAAAAGQNTSLEIVVFLAILLHKAPAAFGLTTFLLSEGHTRKSIRQLLAIFCAVPPLATIATYYVLSVVHLDVPQHVWTGLVLLFSAGSFLYVSTIHVMPELLHRESALNLDSPSTAPARLSTVQYLAMIAGMFTPLLLQVEHGHSHGAAVASATAAAAVAVLGGGGGVDGGAGEAAMHDVHDGHVHG